MSSGVAKVDDGWHTLAIRRLDVRARVIAGTQASRDRWTGSGQAVPRSRRVRAVLSEEQAGEDHGAKVTWLHK